MEKSKPVHIHIVCQKNKQTKNKKPVHSIRWTRGEPHVKGNLSIALGLGLLSPHHSLPTSLAMQSFTWITVIDYLAVSLSLYLCVTFRDHRRRRGLPYPPGPPPLPVIGNLLDFPKRSAWVAYQTMSKKYGRAISS